MNEMEPESISLCVGRAPLSGWVRVSGEDAYSYLQSQFSNDLFFKDAEHPLVYGLWLTRKGGVAADSFVLRRQEGSFDVVSYGCSSETLKAKLEENIIADAVSIDELPLASQPGFVCLLGSGWSAFFESQAVALPPMLVHGRAECLTLAGGYFCRPRPACHDYVEGLFSTAEDLDRFWAELKRFPGVVVWGPEAWEFERIKQIVPRVPQDIGPKDLPHEGGLDLAAVSLTKGCFLGQEIMSRVSSRGSVRRHLVRIRFDSVPSFSVSDALPVPLYLGSECVGELRSFMVWGDDCCGLGLLSRSLCSAHAAGLSFESGGTVVGQIWESVIGGSVD